MVGGRAKSALVGYSRRMALSKAKIVGAYLAGLPPEKRAALQRLRKLIRAAVPAAEECISYGVPAFRLHGKFLVAYAAAAKHCSFFPGSYVRRLAGALKGYDVAKGTIRFQPEKPLPAALVRKLVKGRIAQMAKPVSR